MPGRRYRAVTKILLVEDNEVNREMILRRLGRRGYNLVSAEDGAAAVRSAECESPDIVLMDLDLPVMSGTEAMSAIRSKPGINAVPIIALTAHAMSGDSEQALSAGFDDYVTKPIDFAGLVEKIEMLLRRRAQAS